MIAAFTLVGKKVCRLEKSGGDLDRVVFHDGIAQQVTGDFVELRLGRAIHFQVDDFSHARKLHPRQTVVPHGVPDGDTLRVAWTTHDTPAVTNGVVYVFKRVTDSK